MPFFAMGKSKSLCQSSSPTVRKCACQDEGPKSPDEIERTLAAMNLVQRLEITDEERQQWQAVLGQQNAHDVGASESRVAKLLSHWE